MSDEKKVGQPDRIADEVVKDPGRTPELNVFVGWIGRSGRDGVVRLYLRLDFGSFLEFLEDDVVYTKDADTAFDSSIVWVRRSARLQISESDVDAVRAWKDRAYRDSLSETQLMSVPGHPAGTVSVPSFLLGGPVAGSPLVCTPDSTFAWTCCPLKVATP